MVRKPRRTETVSTVRVDKRVWTGPALSRLIVYALDATHLVLAMEHSMVRALEKRRTLAFRLSDLAVAWGDTTAYSWRFDEYFQGHLGSGVLFG